MSEHPPQTPQELLDAYSAASRLLPWPWSWWFGQKAKKEHRRWDERRDAALRAALDQEHDA